MPRLSTLLGRASSGPYELSHDYSPGQERWAGWVHVLRAVSIVCGLATVLAALATGWLLTGSVAFAAALGAAVGLWPKFLVVSAAVTNTALVDALCAGAIPCLLLWLRSQRLRWAAATGALLGAAALTQVTALPVAGLLLAVLVTFAWRWADWRAVLLALGCFAALCGWWYVRNAILYGNPLATGATVHYLSRDPALAGLIRNPPELSWAVLRSSLTGLGRSTWYDGGWNQLLLPAAVNIAVWVAAAASLGAGFVSALRGKLVLAAAAIGSLVGWVLLIRYTTQPEGRYLLVAIVPWATFLVAGAMALAARRAAASWAWPAIFLAIDAYVLAKWLIPFAHL